MILLHNEVMNFLDKLPKSLPFFSKPEEIEYFFTLNISPERLEAGIWGIEGKKLQILNTATRAVSIGTNEDVDFEKLLNSATRALDEVLADYEIDPQKILFGVPDFWLRDENLKPEYLKVLRRLVKELDLLPLAFVSTTHAISHLIQQQQGGTPPTAILVDVADPLIITILKSGKVVGSEHLARSHQLAEDIQKGLQKIENVEVLPARILIYDSSKKADNLPDLRDQLLSFPWMQKLPFLHLPRVEVLPLTTEIEAVCLAGAVEMNPSVVYHPQKNIESRKVDHKKVSSLGFVKDEVDVIPDEDIFKDEVSSLEDIEGRRELIRGSHRPMEEYGEGNNILGGRKNPLDGVLAGVRAVSSKLSGGRLRGGGGLALLALPVLLIAFILIYVLVPKATVLVFVDPKILENQATVVADPAITEVNEGEKKIPGKVVETDISGTEKGSATGKRQIGEAAKGVVVLYNKTAAPKNFPEGTILNGPNGISFKLDNSVNIASRSALVGGISYGKGTANASATSIGPEGNLAAGKDLTIKGFSADEYSASVDQAFSGGTSKDVTVITADDQKRLLASLTSNLRKQARDKLQEKLTGDFKVLEEGLSETIASQSFTKKVGDQASEFDLNLRVTFKGTAYSEGDLKTIVSKLVQTNVPDGFELNLNEAETQAAVSKLEKDGRLIFNSKFKAKLMPKLDKEKLKKEVSGKTPIDAGEVLRKYENVIGSDIQIKPVFPGPLQRLPLLTQNITIEITAK